MTIIRPRVTASINSAGGTVDVEAPRTLIIGQKLGAGTAVSGALVTDLQNDNAWYGLFGEDSHISHAIDVFRQYNQVSQLDAIGYNDDGAAVAAEATLALGGIPTENGSLFIELGSATNNRITVDIVAAEDPNTVAAKVADAINNSNYTVATAVAAFNVVTLTHNQAGLEGNFTTVRVENEAPGVVITASAFTGGLGSPDVSALLTQIDGLRYQYVVVPATYDISALLTEFEDRVNVDNNILDGAVIQLKADGFADAKAEVDALNSKTHLLGFDKEVDLDNFKGSASRESLLDTSAYLAAVATLRLTEGADLSDFIISTVSGDDLLGGASSANIPFFNTPLNHIQPLIRGTEWTELEIAQFIDSGAWAFANNRVRNTVIMSDLVTTFKTDAAGNTDETFKYYNQFLSASIAREYIVSSLRATYPQHRLVEGDVLPNRNMANALTIRAKMIELYSDLASDDFILVEGGDEALDDFAKNLRVTIDKCSGTVTINARITLVGQLRTILAPIRFSLKFS